MKTFYQIESFGISDQGLVRQNNEDVWHEIPHHSFFVLADGMGGHNAGEVAAKEAVESLSKSIHRMYSHRHGPVSEVEQIATHLHYAIQDANLWVRQLSEENHEFSGMGTTLCCFLLHQETLVYAHVGDSRIYRFREILEQLTEDHSLRTQLIKKGQLDPEKASQHPYRNRITRAIGTNPNVVPDISTTEIQPNDIYFLCSDGLTDYVSDEEIASILLAHSCIKEASRRLVESAKEKGGNDNITIVMVKVLNTLPSSEEKN